MTVWRGRLRRRRLPWTVTVVATAVGLAIASAATTVALRTDSAYDRIRTAHDSVDAASSHNLWPAEAERLVAGLDDPALRSWRHWAGFGGISPQIEPAWRFDVFGPWDGDVGPERHTFAAGRSPRTADEVIIDTATARRSGLEVGDSIDVMFVTADYAGIEPHTFRVVGIGDVPLLAVVDESFDGGLIVVDDDFVRASRHLVTWAATGVDLDDEDLRAAATRVFGALGWDVDLVEDEELARVDAALRPVVVSLLLLGALALLATLVVLLLLHRRELELWEDDADTLAALGVPALDRQRLRVVTIAGPTFAGWLGGMAISLAPTALAPVGGLHEFEPEPGVVFDPRVHLTVLLVLSAVVGFASLPRTEVVGPSATRRLGRSDGPDVAVATWLVRDALAGPSRRVTGALLLGVAATSAITATLVFVTSLDRLVDRPTLYGDTADVVARNPFGQQLPEAVARIAGDSAVTGVTTLTQLTAVVDGVSVPAFALDHVEGSLGLEVREGRLPERELEIAVGGRTLDDLDLAIGDAVTVGSGRPGHMETAEVVGVVVFPTLGTPGVETARLGTGVAMSTGLMKRLGEVGNLPEWSLVGLADGVDPRVWASALPDGVADQTGAPGTWLYHRRPAEIRESDDVRDVLVGGAVVVGTSVAIMLALSSASVVRRQRSRLDVLHGLGMERRRRRRIVVAEVVVLVSIAIAAGVPIGLAIGRVAWTGFARRLGVVPDATGLTTEVALFAVALLATAAAGGVLGSRRALDVGSESR